MTDVLVVGGGSAGSVLAERLSVDPGCMVTMLEAGPGLDDPAVRACTIDATVLPIGPESPVARHYRSSLTEHPPRMTEIVRGSCLGGSGAINGAYFCRALPADVDAIPGLSWAQAQHHYRAVEARIPTSVVSEFSTGTAAFVKAAERNGYRWLPALNADGTGLAPVPLNITGGIRNGPGRAFLAPALGRRNLTVHTRTRVTRIRMVGDRVNGVDAVGPDGTLTVDADRIVVCAGAIATAQLLMLSGIGPAGRLRELGIAVVADLPVGQRCWDHPEWVLTSPAPAVAGRPVLEAVLVDEGLEVRPYTTGFGSATADVGVVLMRPRTHGRVSLKSADPSDPPRIEHHYDSEPEDLADLRRGVERVSAMLAIEAEPRWSTSQHLSGTAPLGIEADEWAVVDPQCRVAGVRGLWVIDGSVLPKPLSRGPHATIAMLAHRAAGFISPSVRPGSAGA